MVRGEGDADREVVTGEGQSLVVGIGNQEHETVSYEVVVHLQCVEFVDNETTVLEERELDCFGATLAHNETHHRDYTVRPPTAGTRLSYLLYRDAPPPEPTVENADRETPL